ncbi:MAG: DUF3427 domain-containing protein, partial [Erysipelotrichaceae bacterium]
MLKQGIYEQVINKKIKQQLQTVDHLHTELEKIEETAATELLSGYVSDVLKTNLSRVGDVKKRVEVVNAIIQILQEKVDDDMLELLEVEPEPRQLLALGEMKQKNVFKESLRPDTSIAKTSLFTGSIHEPQMFSELKKEIRSADQIDMLVSFIKWSGLRLLMEELKEFTASGKKLRVITTSYMGATDAKAIEVLSALPNTEVKISYDTNRTRLHAKSYVFYRDTGFTTAYVGSSNMSNAALSDGLEWNLKVTQKDLPDTLEKIRVTFDGYWNATEFETYTEEQKERLIQSLRKEGTLISETGFVAFDLVPYSYQQEILDHLQAERELRGHYHNLVVAATGTGKTVISAFDYRNFLKQNPKSTGRFLFVAHREEILKQSLFTFQNILRDPNFGDLYVGAYRPDQLDHLFISIQTFNSQDLTKITARDYYDFIIVDEFHHADAPSYQKLLEYYKPKVLLGLTATPERMDGKNVLEYFDHRIAAEIRLPEAIDRKLLCPFQYFGVSDQIDLHEIKWSRGGYDIKTLSNLYASDTYTAKHRAQHVVDSVYRYVSDMSEVKGLGFCVSVEHARFMSEFFVSAGIPSMCLTGMSSSEERSSAKQLLIQGDIRFIFVVDLYNEGVDIPEINTILFLRPTESLTIFLQQLGRGLRLASNKDCLTVLDFIGQASRKYSFQEKFSALLMDTSRSLEKEIKEEFTHLPKGCFVQLERKAQKHILDNIKANISSKGGLVSRIATFEEDSGLALSIENFLTYYHMDIRSLYAKDTFSRLCVSAGIIDAFDEELEETCTKAFKRFCAIDSRRFLTFCIALLEGRKTSFSEVELRMLQMFQFTIWQKSFEECGFSSLEDGVNLVRNNPILCAELLEILRYNYNHLDFVDEPVDLGFDSPLDLHCTYNRDQILVAMDYLSVNTVRQGVIQIKDKKADIFFVTLNKSEKEYSSTTMYNDFSINEHLFHWESQSTTSDHSATGQRYINHKSLDHSILLFVREFKKDPIMGTVAPYTFLGTTTYQSHTGSNPMQIVWNMDRP